MAESWNSGVRGKQVLPLINAEAQTIRVEAGPGTGKAFGLARRVERILHPEGLAAKGRDVLVVAFNRVIAKQLSEDIGARLKTFKRDGEPAIRTIHALCVQVIGEDLRLLLPHEREAMIYDVLQAFPERGAAYKREEGGPSPPRPRGAPRGPYRAVAGGPSLARSPQGPSHRRLARAAA